MITSCFNQDLCKKQFPPKISNIVLNVRVSEMKLNAISIKKYMYYTINLIDENSQILKWFIQSALKAVLL